MDSWYALQVATGREGDIAAMLMRRGIRAMAPAVCRMERKGGEWRSIARRAIPGYVFVRCMMTTPLYYHMTRKPGVIRMLGQEGETYHAIPERQAAWIDTLGQASAADAPSRALMLEDGTLEIIEGPLKALAGQIVKTDARRRRATVALQLYEDTYQIDMALDIVRADKQA